MLNALPSVTRRSAPVCPSAQTVRHHIADFDAMLQAERIHTLAFGG